MKRNIFLALGVVALLVLCAVYPVSARSYSADRFDVDLVVQPDGKVLVTETIDFRFAGGPYTYVFRTIEYNKLDEIDTIQASIDGQPLPEGQQAGQVEIERGKPLKITWHFAPTSDAVHTFTLTYRVSGAVRSDPAGDLLFWAAIPEEHEYEIASSTIRLVYPSSAAALKDPSLEGSRDKPQSDSNGAVFTLSGIDADQSIAVKAYFPVGSLINQPPVWQQNQAHKTAQIQAALPAGFLTLLAAGVLGLLGVIVQNRSLRRDDSGITAFAGQPSITPPGPLAPGLAARLANQGAPVIGMLFDLARRGVLRIEEGQRKWGSRTFSVVRVSPGARLLPHEHEFVQALFHDAVDERVDLKQVGQLAADSRISASLDAELADAGWLDPERKERRSRMIIYCALATVLGTSIMVVGFLLSGFSSNAAITALIPAAVMIGFGAALDASALFGLIVAGQASSLTIEGARLNAAWKSFSVHLYNITRGKELLVTPDLFDRYLPYAAAFGMATSWGKYFQKLGGVSVPDWFQGIQGSFDDGGIAAMIAAISAADSSASSAGDAGAAGASGGGASGAG